MPLSSTIDDEGIVYSGRLSSHPLSVC